MQSMRTGRCTPDLVRLMDSLRSLSILSAWFDTSFLSPRRSVACTSVLVTTFLVALPTSKRHPALPVLVSLIFFKVAVRNFDKERKKEKQSLWNWTRSSARGRRSGVHQW
jgi:hypothetical protein